MKRDNPCTTLRYLVIYIGYTKPLQGEITSSAAIPCEGFLIEDKHYTIYMKINISRKPYKSKEETKKALLSKGRDKMSWQVKDISIEEFVDYALKGYTFAHLYNSDVIDKPNSDGTLYLKFKRSDFFQGAQAVIVDVDETEYDTFDDYVSCLAIRPQVAYSSYSDCDVKGGRWSRRFHLVYIFDDLMDMTTYRAVASYLYDMIEGDVRETITDKCGLSPIQYFNGCYNGEYRLYSSIPLSLSSISPITPPNLSTLQKIPNICEEVLTDRVYIDRYITDFTQSQITEFRSVTDAYHPFYWDNSDPNDWIAAEGIKYQFVNTSTYCRLFYNTEPVKDGNNRRKKLYERVLLRRWMRPTVSADDLFYNYVRDVESDFEVDKDLTVKEAANTVNQVMSMDGKTLYETAKPYIDMCRQFRGCKRGLIFRYPKDMTQGEKNTIRSKVMKNIVNDIYDEDKSPRENLALLKDNGIEIDLSTLYRYVADRIGKGKEDRYDEIKRLYDHALSVNANTKRLKAMGYKISNKTLKKIMEC